MDRTDTDMLSKKMMVRAVRASFALMNPRKQIHNPVMFTVFLSAILTGALFLCTLLGMGNINIGFSLTAFFLVFLTYWGGSFAEGAAKETGKAQADALRSGQHNIKVSKILSPSRKDEINLVSCSDLHKGDYVYVKAGEMIPADGDVAEGAASVDESPITGESAPVIRESDSVRSFVTGGTMVISDWLVIRVTSDPGEGFLDKMIGMVEPEPGKRTPNERRLQKALTVFSAVALILSVVICVIPFLFSESGNVRDVELALCMIGLFVCLMPTTIGGLASAVGIAGMSRLNRANVLVLNNKAIEAAGRVDILMLDKTGTITLGNRRAHAFLPVDGTTLDELVDAAQLASLADETPEGRSIVVLAKELFGLRGRSLEELQADFLPFSGRTRMSGIDYQGNEIRKGAADRIKLYVESGGGVYSDECDSVVRSVAGRGSTPLVVSKNWKVLGVIELKDIVKEGVMEKCVQLRKMGIRTIMLTGDNPLTAAFIAAEAGLDDFLAEASPEEKLALVRDYQAKGHRVAMTGDGDNDAPAMAQADVAVAMNTGTLAARDACNMVDLDSSPTKLIEIVKIGKQLLLTRRSLLIFSIASSIAFYLAVAPVMLSELHPSLAAFSVLGLTSPFTAVCAALLFNTLLVPLLLPVALNGVHYREKPLLKLKTETLLVFGAGGFAVTLFFVKLIDILFNL